MKKVVIGSSHAHRCGHLLLIFLVCFDAIMQPSISHSDMDPRTFTHCAPERCGSVDAIPFPFHLDPSCRSLSEAFRLSCSTNSTSLFLSIGSQSYQVLHFFPDSGGILIDYFPNSTSPPPPSCRQYNDLRSFSFKGNDYFSVSTDNVLGLYDCEDSSLCNAEDCEKISTVSGICDGNRTNSSPGGVAASCCYPLSDPSVWHIGEGFSVFAQFGCRGFSSWVVSTSDNLAAKRGVKLEWAVPSHSAMKQVCDPNAQIVNVTSVRSGVRCQCQDGFVGDGFAQGVGCLKFCLKNGEETYGRDCYMKAHGRRKLILLAGLLASAFSIASLVALFCLLKCHRKLDTFDHDQSNNVSFLKACRTHLFTYQELEEATKGFEDSQKIVDVNKGTIYAGVIGNGLHLAVHKLQCTRERDLIQVMTRVEVLSAVSHRNIARLLGCSIDSGYTPLVVYEYPANGTLEEILRQSRLLKIGLLDWHKRLSIAAETAGVLAFLQSEIIPPVSHHDLRSGCILLDEGYCVKLAGFELFSDNDTDDLVNNAELGSSQMYTSSSSRSDVYSLGVVILEIIAGSLDLPPPIALHKIRSGKLEEMVDPLLYYHEQDGNKREQIEAVADLGTRCLLFGGDGKLGMSDVARELVHIRKGNNITADGTAGSRRGPPAYLEETFSNSSLLQMISMSPDSIYLP